MAQRELFQPRDRGKALPSEEPVKQYVNQIYSKLHMEGDTRPNESSLPSYSGKRPNLWLMSDPISSSFFFSLGTLFYGKESNTTFLNRRVFTAARCPTMFCR